MRKPIVAGNWKMHKSIGEAIDLAAEIKQGVAGLEGVEVVLCPPYTALKSVGDLVRYSGVQLGAQDVHWEANGAFTGEVSVRMLDDLACAFVIVGHSERRTYFHETDEDVARKVRAVLEAGLCPIVCVGETLEQRDGGQTEQVVIHQVQQDLAGLGARVTDLVIAYEPVWAIGTGRTPTSEEVQWVHTLVRSVVADLADAPTADAVRIQYGGSVKPSNAAELFALPDVDGGLIGGASLDAPTFLAIVNAAAPAPDESASPPREDP